MSMQEEVCPFCQRENSPGAVDVCKHFVGMTDDSMWIMGHELVGPLVEALSDVHSMIEAREMDGRDCTALQRLVLTSLEPLLAEQVLEGYGLIPALMDAAAVAQLDHPTLHTMTSGCGTSYYTPDPDSLSKWLKTLAASVETLRARCSEVLA